MTRTLQTDDAMLRGVIAARRRARGWKTSADHYDLAKIEGASDEFVAWARANIPQRVPRP